MMEGSRVPFGWSVALIAVGVIAFGLGRATSTPVAGPPTADEASGAPGGTLVESGPVTGIGGVFFKSDAPEETLEWYRTHLGIEPVGAGHPFQWRELGDPEEIGYTFWAPFPTATDYFEPSEAPFMVNFRVSDLASLIDALRGAGVVVVGAIEDHPNGRFAWVLDPEGRKVELWQPVPSAEDPYLR